MSTLSGGLDFTLSPKALTLIVVAETPFCISLFRFLEPKKDNLRAALAFSEVCCCISNKLELLIRLCNLMANLSTFLVVSVSCTFHLKIIIFRLSDLNESADLIFFTLFLDLLAALILFLGCETFSRYFLTQWLVFWDAYWIILFRGKNSVLKVRLLFSWGSYGSYIIVPVGLLILDPAFFAAELT